MRQWSLGSVVAAAGVLLIAALAQATVVTVTPENMQGWSIEVNVGGPYDEAYFGKGGSGEIINGGPAVWEQETPFLALGTTSLGKGAFYATCNYSGDPSPPGVETPSTVWLGRDTFNGQPLAGITLNRITEMKYYAYVAKILCRQMPYNTQWDYTPYWTYPRHPISLQLTAESPDGSDRRQFWYFPWRPFNDKIRGENSGINTKRWILYDCMGPDPYEETYIRNRWYCYRTNIAEEQTFDSWGEVIAQYGSWKLVATSTDAYPTGYKSSGWDGTTNPSGSPTCTATGMCLNFEVGARKCRTRIFHEESAINWWADFCGFRGYMDRFTLGIDGTSVTYDFEPSPTAPEPKIAARSMRAQGDSIMREPFVQNYYQTKLQGLAWGYDIKYFNLDDGYRPSGSTFLPIRVYAMDEYHEVGSSGLPETWSAWGLLEKPRIPGSHYVNGTPMPYCLWTTLSHCLILNPIW